MSEELLVQHCSPTLAGIKTASLYTCPFEGKENMLSDLRKLNQRFSAKGLRILPMRLKNNRVLIYLYRPKALYQDFQQELTQKILLEQGYSSTDPEACIPALIEKLRKNKEFPHEIGLFLGYPPEDVQGFIEHNAQNYKCVGCWKVYGDEKAACALFDQYEQCTQEYTKRMNQGASLDQLALPA